MKHQLLAGLIGLMLAGCASHEPPQPTGAWMPIGWGDADDYVVGSAPSASTPVVPAKPAQPANSQATAPAVPASTRSVVPAAPKPQGVFHDVSTR